MEIKKCEWSFHFETSEPSHHKNHPNSPEIILDDLGFSNEREIPRPGVYYRKQCKCGIKHAWTAVGEQTFYIGHIRIFDRDIPCKVCIKCRETLVLELEKPYVKE